MEQRNDEDMSLRPGSKIHLVVPENPRLHNAQAVVKKLTDWGAYVNCPAAATGEYRALYSEMEEGGKNGHSRTMPCYTGDVCSNCGTLRMRRNGTCLVCDDCGTTTGCG